MTQLKRHDFDEAGRGSLDRLPFLLDAPGSVKPKHEATPFMRWVRRILSTYLVFHLLAVLLAPNSENYLGARIGWVFRPYLFFFEMTNGWNFFSPNPEPPIYVEYELLNENGEAYVRSSWPEKKDPFFLRERQNRRISATDFMMAAEERTEKMMVPYLCNQSPKPRAVRLWRLMYSTPTPEEVASGKRTLGDEVGIDRRFVSHTFCPGGAS